LIATTERAAPEIHESFLLLFFKKEALPSERYFLLGRKATRRGTKELS
jgi:hypothetical protein